MVIRPRSTALGDDPVAGRGGAATPAKCRWLVGAHRLPNSHGRPRRRDPCPWHAAWAPHDPGHIPLCDCRHLGDPRLPGAPEPSHPHRSCRAWAGRRPRSCRRRPASVVVGASWDVAVGQLPRGMGPGPWSPAPRELRPRPRSRVPGPIRPERAAAGLDQPGCRDPDPRRHRKHIRNPPLLSSRRTHPGVDAHRSARRLRTPCDGHGVRDRDRVGEIDDSSIRGGGHGRPRGVLVDRSTQRRTGAADHGALGRGTPDHRLPEGRP